MNFTFKNKLKSPFAREFLVIHIPDGPTRHVSLRAATLEMGRAEANQIVIDHPSISRRHARLTRQGDGLLIEDLASANGTWVNDQTLQPYKPAPIARGQSFWVGKVEVTYKHQDFTLPIVGVFFALLCCCAAVQLIIRLIPQPDVFACDAPSILIVQPDPNQRPAAADEPARPTATRPPTGPTPAETQAAGEPTSAPLIFTDALTYTVQNFFDLPFPYAGDRSECTYGTLEEFQQANQRRYLGGRINSFFDHFYPKYPYDPERQGRESPDPPEAKNLLLFTGELSANDDYSGHPGYDYSYEYTTSEGKYTTPVCAAANGIIAAVGGDEQVGLYVKINHFARVNGVSYRYQTFYLHLKQDEFFDQMLGREGQIINVHERIGTIGNTGPSTGPHLHFEVRADLNNDNRFDLSEVVDPYGYIPSREYPVDKWPRPSDYLWIHPWGVFQSIEGNAQSNAGAEKGIGGEFAAAVSRPARLCAPPNALPSGGLISFSISLSPPPADGLISIGRAAIIAVMNQGQFIETFAEPVRVMIPFPKTELDYVKDNERLRIYRLQTTQQADKDVSVWIALQTELDREHAVAMAYTDSPGQFALLGEATQDTYPPTTEITLDGPQSPEGTFYANVTVSLAATDGQSGVDSIYYSLDGRNWLLYSEPFVISPNGIPEALPETEDESFLGGPGRFQVLASATDKAGNSEEQLKGKPAAVYFIIDPRKEPQRGYHWR